MFSSLCGTGIVLDEPSKCMKLLLLLGVGAFLRLLSHLFVDCWLSKKSSYVSMRSPVRKMDKSLWFGVKAHPTPYTV